MGSYTGCYGADTAAQGFWMLHAPIVYFSVSPELALPDGAAPAIALAALEAWKLLAHCTSQIAVS